MDELERVPEGEEGLEEAAPPAPPWSPWCDLPPPSRPFAERALMDWVEHVFRSGWPEPAENVKRDWPYHPDVVATLRGLKAKLDAIYSPPVKDREIGAAPLYRMMDWDLDLERAIPRFKDSFRPCPGPDGECSRSKPPSYSELAGPQNQAETDQAADGAWGAVPPDIPPPMEPWEVARRIADAQTAASEREDTAEAESAAVDDILGPAQTW